MARTSSAKLALLVQLVSSVLSFNLLTSLDSLNKTAEYDFIIVGGGTAGSVLAARLTEDPRTRVLLVEAGGREQDTPNVAIPFLAVTLPGTAVDWNYTTVPQPGYDGRTVGFARGHVLGGSSCINLLTYHRGSDGAWDHWANLTGDEGWSWKEVQKFYLENSRLVEPADHHNTFGEEIPSAHGDGPVQVSNPGFPYAIDNLVIEAARRHNGDKFFYNPDYNAGEALGTSYMQSSVGGGRRSCASTAYLEPLENGRANLDILIHTQANRLTNVNSSCSAATPDLRTVELQQTADGPKVSLTAKREVILSAGVIGTPKILLLSGIGPVDELKALGIETVVESPDVGHHFYDHPLVPLYFSVHSNETFDNLLRNPDLIGAAVGEIMANGTGPLVDSPANTLHYSRVDFESLLPGSSDPANSADSAHVEIIFCTGFAALSSLQQPASGGFTSLLAAVVSPLSEGNVTLNSTDPFANPLIDPAYLTHEFDQAAMVTAIKDGFDFIRQPPLDEFVGAPFGPLADATTDDELLAYARSFGVTLNHGSGTARMAAKSSKDGVVDPDLLVKGVKGLRIVDASIFPQQPNVHTQAVVYIAAERAAELIKSAYSLN